MAAALNKSNILLLKAASDDYADDIETWEDLEVYLLGADDVDIDERKPTDWMRMFENFRRIIREDHANAKLLKAAYDPKLPDDFPLRKLKMYLRGAGVNTAEREDDEWMTSFKEYRRRIREGNECVADDQSPTIDIETKSHGTPSSDSGYHSDSGELDWIPSSNEKSTVVLFVPHSGGEELGFGCCCDTETEGNYIRQTAYNRLHDKHKLQKDSDGMLNLSFSDKTKTKTIDGRFSVVPDSDGRADVVFGRDLPRTPTEDVEEECNETFDGRLDQICETSQTPIDDFNSLHESQRLEVLTHGIGTMLRGNASNAYDNKEDAEHSGATYFHAINGALKAAAAPQRSSHRTHGSQNRARAKPCS